MWAAGRQPLPNPASRGTPTRPAQPARRVAHGCHRPMRAVPKLVSFQLIREAVPKHRRSPAAAAVSFPNPHPKNEVLTGTLPWELEPRVTGAWVEGWYLFGDSGNRRRATGGRSLESHICLVERTSYLSKSSTAGDELRLALTGDSSPHSVRTRLPFPLSTASFWRREEDTDLDCAPRSGVPS